AKWDSFSSSLDLASVNLIHINLENYLSAYRALVNAITETADQCFPIKKQARILSKISSPWWDSDCSSAVRERKNAEIEYNNSMTPENYIKYKRYAAKASRVLTKKKKLGWKSFCENLSPRTPPSIVWNQIKRFRGSCNTSIITSNDPFSWIDPFTDKLAPSFVPFIDSLPTPSSYITPSSVFDAVFSINELNLALDGLKDSSPGVDGIPYSFLSNYRKYSHLPHPVVQYQTFPLFSISFEALTFKPNIILDFGINKYSTNARNEFYERMDSEYNGWRTIYTDASKLDNTSSVGAAVWIPSTKIILNFKCPSVSSVFTGEATAILESIQFIKSHNLNNTIIFSDSKSSLQSILSNPFRSKSNFPIMLQIRESLFRCHELGLNVVMAWIPSHTGIP
ncbi:putative pol-like protein, partial [Operophtera brumata]